MDRLSTNDKQNSNYERHSNNKVPDFENFFQGVHPKTAAGAGWTYLRRILRKDWRTLFFSCILYVVQYSPVWVLPLVTSDIIDLLDERPENLISRLIVDCMICLFVLLQNVPVTMVRLKIINRAVRNQSAQLKQNVIQKLQKLSITYHHEIEEGKIQSKILRDVESVESYYRTAIENFPQTLIAAAISITIAIWKSPITAAFFVILVPAYILFSMLFRKPLRSGSRELRKENEQLSAQLTTTMQIMLLTKSHGLVDVEEKAVNQKINAVKQTGLRFDKTNSMFGSISWVCSQMFALGCLAFCVVMALNDRMTTGEIMLYQSLFSTISSSVLGIIGVYPVFVTGNEAVNSIAEIMQSAATEHDGSIKIESLEGKVEFRDVCYHYPNSEKLVVSHFSLSVKNGERIAIVGASGSGKSTIINLVIGLLTPSSGEILVDGIPLSGISMQSYRKYISIVPQNSILFSGTIRENITYGLDAYSEEELRAVVEQSNITEFLNQLPNGLDTQVGDHGDKLSGGQKQRISIARALIRKPRILILDEATSALDNVSEYHVQKAIDEVLNARTAFIVAHRLSTIRNANRIVVMEDGQMVEVGTYDELMSLKGKFYELERKSRIRETEMDCLSEIKS